MRRAIAVVAAIMAAGAFGLLAVVTVGVATDAWRIVPVRSGSMEPSIPTGAAAFARPVDADDLAVGDVIVFHPPTGEEVLIVHRIVGTEVVDGAEAYRTQGDANASPDPWLVTFDDSRLWKVQRVVPWVGRVQASLSGVGLRVGALVLGGILVLGVGLSSIWRRRDDDDDRLDLRDDGSETSGTELDEDPLGEPVGAGAVPSGIPTQRRTRRFPSGVSVLLALVVAAALVPVEGAWGAFGATGSTDAEYSTGVLNSPSPLGCFWGDFLAPNNQLVWPVWTNTSPDFASEYRILRSTTSGGPYTQVGTASPSSLPISVNFFTPKTQIHYYAIQAARGPWTGPLSNEVASNECSGAINAYAGAPPSGFGGDGGPALSASFDQPFAVAFDSAGNGFIADATTNRIRRVDAVTGIVTTFAGGGGTPSACTYSGSVGGLNLNLPLGIAIDAADNVYVSDTGQGCIRRITPGGSVALVAGGGATADCQTSGAPNTVSMVPAGIAVDQTTSSLVVADIGNNCVRRITATTYSHVAGGGATPGCTTSGAATAVQLNLPVAVAVAPSGDVVFTDAGNNCVRRVSGANYSHVLGGGATTSCWATGAATSVSLSLPLGVAIGPDGRIYVSDSQRSCVRRVTATNVAGYAFDGTAGLTGDNGPALHARAQQPAGLAFDPSGDLAIADQVGGVVRKVISPS